LKLGKNIILAIAVGAFVIILASLGMILFQSRGELTLVEEQFTQTELQLQRINLDKLSAQQTDLEDQLRDAESQLELIKGVLSEPTGSVAAATGIFEMAESYGLTVTGITSPGPDIENLEGVILEVVSLTAEVNGDVPGLVDFTTALNSYFTTGAVKTVTITVPDDSSADNATASVQLVVYTYRGD